MTPSFEESYLRFRVFLTKNGFARETVWITSEDVILGGERLLYVKLPVPNSNHDHARGVFESATNKKSGVSFSAIGETDAATPRTVCIPDDVLARHYSTTST